ncbi:MAG TPA: RraA family protein [Methylomirabilota bacterium]|nr:RraA family protein [Methylomirabilota bacterium]
MPKTSSARNSPIRLRIERPPRDVVDGLRKLAPTALADFLTLPSVMRHAIRPLWPAMPRIAGPAFTVRTARHDNLMLHAAIYRAEPGDVIVVQAGDEEMAVAGGNVCAVAQRHGVAGFVIDGVVRDVGEARANGFPIFARGVSPIPGAKEGPGAINGTITCGGIKVHPGDVVVADEEGIVVVPLAQAAEILKKAQAKAETEAAQSLDDWEKKHRARVDATLKAKRYLV